MHNRSGKEILTWATLGVAILAIVVPVVTPQIQRCFGLEEGICLWGKEKNSSPTSASPNNSESFNDYMKKGADAHNAKKLKESIEFYTEAIKLNPKSIQAYESRGAVHRNLGANEKADSDYETAKELSPK